MSMGSLFAIRPRVFVSYHHRGDQPYYDAFSKHFHDTHEAIYDNSLERRVDSDDVDYVRRRIWRALSPALPAPLFWSEGTHGVANTLIGKLMLA